MREILFRGKSDLLGWVEGWYCPEVKWGEHHFPVGITHKTKEGWLDDVVVMPETIGQFSGLTDKNGTKIFEGDILDCKSGLYERCKVIFNEYCSAFQLMRADSFSDFFLCSINHKEMEIIGNIHDNPELLGGAADGE